MQCSNWIRSVLLVLAFHFFNQADCVVNGTIVEDVNQFKYLVGIQIEFESSGQLCGGAILDDYMILTAAHCLVNHTNDYERPEKVKIRLHTLKNRDSMLQMKRYAQKLYIPTAYLSNTKKTEIFESDIAVIQVKKSMNLIGNSKKLQKVELPEQDYLTDGDRGVFAAYGVYEFEGDEPLTDGRLRSLNVEVVPNHRCPTALMMASKTRMCVKPNPVNLTEAQGSCYGDSGSTIVINRHEKLEVIGVCSSVEDKVDCDIRKARGFFTKVPKFTNWIRNVMKNTYGASDTTVIVMPHSTSCFW